MLKKVYIHTIDGSPARYWKNDQICYWNWKGENMSNCCTSLEQIKKEQELSNNWKKKRGLFHSGKQGYFILRLK